MPDKNNFFHLHLISDSTGETLITIARAAAARYANIKPIEHMHPLVKTEKQLEEALAEIEQEPGIVLYTIVNEHLCKKLQQACESLNLPSVSVLEPILTVLQTTLGTPLQSKIGAQHTLNKEYFKRIEALNYTFFQDDGQNPEGLKDADIILIGVSRTSKTPTSIYLANRGYKTANVPYVPEISLPEEVYTAKTLKIGLIANPERISQIRQNRLESLNKNDMQYADKLRVSEEINLSKKHFLENQWHIIDVTRKSIEETAAEVILLYKKYKKT